MEALQLRVAWVGFSPTDDHLLRTALRQLSAQDQPGPRWVQTRHEHADAWVLHPQVLQADTTLGVARVWDGLDQLASTTIQTAAFKRPIALAQPSALNDPPDTSTAAWPSALGLAQLDAASLHLVLQAFEGQLRLLRTQFTLGEWLAKVRPNVATEQRGYHLLYRGLLVGIVNAEQFRVSFGPKAVPLSVAESEWVLRPNTAMEPPPDFHTVHLSECLWHYSQRSAGNHLPDRYRSKPIHFWRMPPMRAGYYQDEHLGLIDMVRGRPSSFPELLAATGWSEPVLAKALEGLYVTGAISTQSAKPAAAGGLLSSLFSRRADTDSSLLNDSQPSSVPSVEPMRWAMDTAPSELRDLPD